MFEERRGEHPSKSNRIASCACDTRTAWCSRSGCEYFIEEDDNGTISWEEFESFFMSAGWATSTSVAGSVRASMNSFVTTAAENRSKTSDATSGRCRTCLINY